jgi:Tat protein secretion system quality control protein TatD with DNase activity
VVKKMAKLRGVDYEEMAEITVNNSKCIFGL